MASDPPVVPHDFGIEKLAYDKPPNKQKYWRIMMYFQKKPGISHEYFANHWHHVHADFVVRATGFKKHNILRYNQYFQSEEARELAQMLKGKHRNSFLEWDAVTEFYVKDVKDFLAFTQTDEYLLATPDIVNFVNVESGIRMAVGYDHLVYGAAIPGLGENGVQHEDLLDSRYVEGSGK